jgi:hypothetical protein
VLLLFTEVLSAFLLLLLLLLLLSVFCFLLLLLQRYIVVDLGQERQISEIGVDFGNAAERLPTVRACRVVACVLLRACRVVACMFLRACRVAASCFLRACVAAAVWLCGCLWLRGCVPAAGNNCLVSRRMQVQVIVVRVVILTMLTLLTATMMTTVMVVVVSTFYPLRCCATLVAPAVLRRCFGRARATCVHAVLLLTRNDGDGDGGGGGGAHAVGELHLRRRESRPAHGFHAVAVRYRHLGHFRVRTGVVVVHVVAPVRWQQQCSCSEK